LKLCWPGSIVHSQLIVAALPPMSINFAHLSRQPSKNHDSRQWITRHLIHRRH
jgi:hypothetical protein